MFCFEGRRQESLWKYVFQGLFLGLGRTCMPKNHGQKEETPKGIPVCPKIMGKKEEI